jgi:hypothetical protein
VCECVCVCVCVCGGGGGMVRVALDDDTCGLYSVPHHTPCTNKSNLTTLMSVRLNKG